MNGQATPHPALGPLAVLVGEWQMILSNASFLEDASASVESTVSFRWVQGGAYLLLVQGEEAVPRSPTGRSGATTPLKTSPSFTPTTAASRVSTT